MKDENVRVTAHNARAAGTSKHNDRNFDVSKADHIDADRSVNNIYWTWNKGMIYDSADQTFEESEEEFYEKTFRKGLDKRNKNYKEKGKSKFIKSMEEYHKGIQSRPEEVVWMIGDKNTCVPPGLLWDIVMKEMDWRTRMFPQVVPLDIALHADEEGGIHIQERHVWVGHDDDGDTVVGQKKALTEMGIERPDLNRDEDRYNNSKMTYTRMCRDHFIELCEEHGFKIEKEPREASMSGKKMLQFQVDALKADIVELESKREELLKNTEYESETLEHIMEDKVKAAKIKKTFGDKETVTYHKNSIDLIEGLTTKAREYRDDANRYHSWAVGKVREAEKLKEEAAEGIQLKNEYTKKKKDLDKIITDRANELADQRLSDVMASIKNNEYTRAMISFMSRFASLEGKGTLYDDFDRAYIEMIYNEPAKAANKETLQMPDNDIDLTDDDIEH